ncbi:MAG: SRPBCC family protein [Bacteroidota bacterium]
MNTKIEKNFELDQPINKVWAALANPEEIVTCVPGAAITEKIDEKNYKGEVVTKFGPIKAKYSGDIEIQELDEANKKMVLKGRGLDSKGKGSADMIMNGSLTEEGGKTKVNFTMDITIVGMLAQFGSRLINDVSDQLLNQFVDNFKDKLAGEEVDNTMDASTMLAAAPKSAVIPMALIALGVIALLVLGWFLIKSIF